MNRKKQKQLREMQFAIRQSNMILRNLREWNLVTLRDYTSKRMRPAFLFEALKIRIPVYKDKTGKPSTKGQLIQENCSAENKEDCIFSISTSFPFKRVIELKVAQSNARKVSLKVCYGTTIARHHQGGQCVERIESEFDKQISQQKYFFDAEYYFARSEWKSLQDYAQTTGKNNADCDLLPKLKARMTHPTERTERIVKNGLAERERMLIRYTGHRVQRSKIGY